MCNRWFYIILLWFIPGFFAAQKHAENTVLLNGKIMNASSNVIILRSEGLETEYSMINGTFNIELNLEKSGFVELQYKRNRLSIYLFPGSVLFMQSEDGQFFESLIFSGKGADENNYYSDKRKFNLEQVPNQRSLYGLPEMKFIPRTDEILAERMAFLKSFYSEHNTINPSFIRLEELEILYEWAIIRENYPKYHKVYTKIPEIHLSESYYGYSSNLPLNDPLNLSSTSFLTFANKYVNRIAEVETNLATRSDQLNAVMETIHKEFSNPMIREYLQFKRLYQFLNINGIKDVEELIDKFLSESIDGKHISSINSIYQEWLSIEPGNPAPDINCVDSDGNIINLNSLKGKVIYIDVWASWCGPCRRELPHFKELVKKYSRNKEVAIIAISIDTERENWVKVLEEKNLKGIQLLDNRGWNSDICRKFFISGIPRYILISKEGDILDANAPAPSSEKIIQLIDQYAS